ncbi:MAG: efflux RND transporter periplasmic adaptor subunit [Turicibacter sp.]|nr:efflux RND transporter periplasmic adaptor subunit [Turicibacter sp.]
MSRMKKVIIAVVVVLAAGGFVAFNLFNINVAEAAGGGNAPIAQWVYPHRQTVVRTVNARGTVELRNRTIVFPETQAQILHVHVNEGDFVNVGDVLITYDDSILDTLNDNLAEARIALQSAQLGLAATQIAPSATEILSAENQVEQARANITAAETNLVQIDVQIAQIEENLRSQTAQIQENLRSQTATIEENLRRATETRNNVQTLFDAGVATRTELDNATHNVTTLEDQLATTRRTLEDQLATTTRNLEDQLTTTRLQRETAELQLGTSTDSERFAQENLSAIRGRNAQPAAVNQANIQRLSIEQAELRIAQIERNIADFQREEIAATAGTIISVNVEPGEFSVNGRPMFEIADVSGDNLIVVVNVPENDSGTLTVGQETNITGGALGNLVYSGHIDAIRPVAVQRNLGTGMETVVIVEVIVPNNETLRAGFTVDADIITMTNENSLVVPIMSTLSEGGTNFVYVITNNFLERVDVTLGEFVDMYIEVSGLTETDMVVSSPTPQMHNGLMVRPVGP